MAERITKEEKMSLCQKKLEDGVKEIFSSEKYKEYLSAMSKFHNYSINNCILIASQKPDASYVCGFRKWQQDFNRTVNKGEKGIMILAPIKGKEEIKEEVFDEFGKAVLDENGDQRIETVKREYLSFKPVYVFDISQTSGDTFPSICEELDSKVDSFEDLKEILERISPVPVVYEAIQDTAHGYYSPASEKIVIKKDLPELQMIKTMIHEIAHATLGHGKKDEDTDRRTKEVQAESVAFLVTSMLGFDTSGYSFGYITGWSRDKEVSELKESLDKIKQATDKIYSAIEEKLLDIKVSSLPLVSEPPVTFRSSNHR